MWSLRVSVERYLRIIISFSRAHWLLLVKSWCVVVMLSLQLIQRIKRVSNNLGLIYFLSFFLDLILLPIFNQSNFSPFDTWILNIVNCSKRLFTYFDSRQYFALSIVNYFSNLYLFWSNVVFFMMSFNGFMSQNRLSFLRFLT